VSECSSSGHYGWRLNSPGGRDSVANVKPLNNLGEERQQVLRPELPLIRQEEKC
jgi:hypothetical protein